MTPKSSQPSSDSTLRQRSDESRREVTDTTRRGQMEQPDALRPRRPSDGRARPISNRGELSAGRRSAGSGRDSDTSRLARSRQEPVQQQLGAENLRVRRKSPAGADTVKEGPRIQLQPRNIPPAAMDTISALSVRNADVANLLRGIGEQYSVNLIVEDRIQKKTTIRLSQISVLDALQVICQEQDLSLVQTGPVFRIRTPPEPPPEPPSVTHENGRITMDLSDDKLTTVAETLTKKTGTNVIVSDGVDGTLNGYLERVPLESGLSTLLTNNGYTLRKREDILVIDRQPRQRQGEGGNRERRRGTSLQVNAEEGEVDLDVREAPVQDVLSELAARMNLNLVTYKPPQGRISATVEDMSLDQVFDLLFRTSNVTYRRKDSTYFVGTRKTSSIATTELISLNHVKAKRVPEMLPQTLKKKATIKVISEHNGLMMTGANNAIEQLRSAVEALDKPTPLILIEALVVDFTTTDLFELGLEFGQDAERSEQAKKEGYRYGEDGFQLEGEDQKLNQYLKDLVPLTSNFGIRNIGELPKDFFLKLRALSQEGKVDIRSRPQVAALSGHTASIEIGQTQYFILRKETPVQSPEGGAVIQETERFEKIEANVSLEITPWVTSSGEVTTEIRPEFSQPVGEFNAEKPPTINTRILESTVRLKEGETIILGGLVRDRENVQYNKIPVLGSIPWLGKLFSSRTSNKEKSELVIYLTPHVFYGSKDEPEKWQQLREQMDLRDPREKQ